MNLIEKILLFIVCPIVSLGYVLTPTTNDVRIFIGVEAIADKFYPFPQGIDLAWEIKPIGNRLMNWGWYKLLDILGLYGNYFWSDIAIKVVALAIIIAVAYYASKALATPYSFYLTFIALAAISNFGILQAEYWAVLFALTALSALLRGHPYIAGGLTAFIFLLKGITGLFVVEVFLLAFLLDENTLSNWKKYVTGYVSIASLFVLSWLLIWHNMVSDILLSPQLARVGLHPAENVLVWFFAQLVTAPIHTSILIGGLIFGAFFYFSFVKHQGWKFKSAYLLSWIIPSLMVIIQGELFVYHYVVYIPVAIVTICLCERYSK